MHGFNGQGSEFREILLDSTSEHPAWCQSSHCLTRLLPEEGGSDQDPSPIVSFEDTRLTRKPKRKRTSCTNQDIKTCCIWGVKSIARCCKCDVFTFGHVEASQSDTHRLARDSMIPSQEAPFVAPGLLESIS